MISCNYNLPQGNSGQIERISLTSESVDDKNIEKQLNWDFFKDFLIANKPCIININSIVQQWSAMLHWVKINGDINFEYLLEQYANVEVSVTQIDMTMTYDDGGMDCSKMLFKDYIHYWIKYKKSGYSKSMPCLYLKDWHILKNYGHAETTPYEVLPFFSSDWLNETCSDEIDDFRFCYMGPKGSGSGLHADVYGSFSWSFNVFGTKKWHLYPPGREKQEFIEVIQNAGETIFVPSGWYHIVWNETDVISINHNWFNASNICYIWHQLENALNLVKNEIQEFKEIPEFSQQCQLILKANHGMNLNDFYELISKIWRNRMQNMNSGFTNNDYDMTVLKHLIQDHIFLLQSNLSKEWKESFQKLLLSAEETKINCCPDNEINLEIETN